MKTTVLLVDDHMVVREGLRALLKSHTDLEIVGEAENGQEAVALAGRMQPQVVLMDIAMPLLNGRDATRRILEAAPDAKILVLSSYQDEDCVNQMLAAGASGYLLKHSAAQDLAQAIRQVRRGGNCLSPALDKSRQRNRQPSFQNGQHGHGSNGLSSLTPREKEVLQLIAEGLSNQEAADKLGISIKTIEKHRQQVMNKLNIHEVAGLTRFAISHRIVDRHSPAMA